MLDGGTRMTVAVAVCATVVIVALLVLRDRENDAWREIVANLSLRALEERASLLDRIQHPERVQVQGTPDGYEPPEPPPDAAELAYIGQEVPDFVSVGTAPTAQELDHIGREVPENVHVGGSNA